MNESLSETYTYLYHTIVEELLSQIVQNNHNYYVQRKIENLDFPIALERKFKEYRHRAQQNMSSQRLDRHKLASCICGAIIETRPLCGKGTAKNANELLALRTGLSTVKAYMVYETLHKLQISYEEKDGFRKYLAENFMMKFPSNICDTRPYEENFANALYQTHSKCAVTGKECFHYDLWAYAKLFYHLELYNQPAFTATCQKYLKNSLRQANKHVKT